jgi:formylglycine-generating enzyme required for sulfatase activity
MVAIPGSALLPAFFMGQYPVTQVQWEGVAKLPRSARDLHPNPACFQAPELPVESVSWLDAVEFCARLSSHTGRLYSLPSEAQWEYACRAGTTTPFHYGNTVTSELANYVATYTYAAEHRGHYRQTTTPVGSFAPNAFGLYDMHGNVWEWSADRWLERSPQALMTGKTIGKARDWRVLRGGSWSDPPVNIRAATRTGNAIDALNRLFGFRLCCVA